MVIPLLLGFHHILALFLCCYELRITDLGSRSLVFGEFLSLVSQGLMGCTKCLAHLHAKASIILGDEEGAYEIARYDQRVPLVKSIIPKIYAQTSDGRQQDPLLCR